MTDTIFKVELNFPETEVYATILENIDFNSFKGIILSQENPDLFCLFLNPQRILSLQHLQHSLHKSIYNYRNKLMRSKYLASEIFYNLGYSQQIKDCVRVHGIDENSKSALIVQVSQQNKSDTEHKDPIKHLNAVVSLAVNAVKINPRDRLGKLDDADKAMLIKMMEVTKDELELHGGLEAAVLGRIAIKGI